MVSTLQHPRPARAGDAAPAATVEDKLPVRPKRPRARAAAAAAAPPPAAIAGELDTAPLHLFELSELNVRKTYAQDEVAEMAESLARHGQLQNLVAVPTDGGKLAVIAGGRRLRGLWQLREQGRVTPDHPVSVRLAAPEEGRETSLVENVTRVALNPVDEIRAYRAIVDDHAADPDPVLTCARRQGVARAHVERMLRLDDLAPDILEALGTGRIELAAAQAYGTTGDRALQVQVFAAEERREFGPKHKPGAIREAIRGRSYPADVPAARYVGLDAYRSAGGRVDRDLFFGADDGELLRDPALLDRLARDKATAELPARADESGLASGVLVNGFVASPGVPKPPATHMYGAFTLDQLPPAVRAAAIGVYTLAGDGSGLELHRIMVPIVDPTPAPAAAERPAAAEPPARVGAPPPRPLGALPARLDDRTPAETMADLREQSIRRRAAGLAARAIAVAALPPDRIVEPNVDEDRDEMVELADNGDLLVMILMRIHPDELEAQRATAAAELDADDSGGGWRLGSR